jgi:hypothetical protein
MVLLQYRLFVLKGVLFVDLLFAVFRFVMYFEAQVHRYIGTILSN